MRSIKEQRDDNALGQEQIELLDWAERAREYIKNMVPVLGGDGLGIVDKLLEELPEE